MFNIETVPTKAHGMGKAKLHEELENLIRRLEAEMAKKSTGAYGKLTEVLVRHMLMAAGLEPADFRARPQGKDDAMIRVDGRTETFEVKTGGGIVYYSDEPSQTLQLPEADVLFNGADLVAWAPEAPTFTCMDDLLDGTFIVPRALFLSQVLTAGQKRKPCWQSGLKTGTNSKVLREANKARAEGEKPYRDCFIFQPTYWPAMVEEVNNGEYDTLRTYLEDIGRA